jgi:hypothetical protein
MTITDLAAYAVRVIVAVLAIVTARKRREHRHLAFLFSVLAIADILAAFIVSLIREVPTPYTGAPRALYHVTQACFLVLPAAIASAAWVTFYRRTLRPVAIAYGIACAVAFLGYPHLRREPLGWYYAGVNLVAIVAECACLFRWLRLRASPGMEQRITINLAVMHIAACLGPYWHGDPFARWGWAQFMFGALYAALLVVYGGALLKPQRPQLEPRDRKETHRRNGHAETLHRAIRGTEDAT